MPQGLAVLATPGALKQVERIRTEANAQRSVLNNELSGVAKQLNGQHLAFPVRASETGKLYGSVTTRQIAQKASEKFGVEISHRQVDTQAIRNLGEFMVAIRLTLDLAPEITIIVHNEGETPEITAEEVEEEPANTEAAEDELEPEPAAEALQRIPVAEEVER